MGMKLLEPAVLAGVPLRNRIAVGPMSRTQGSEDGLPSPDAANYYARYCQNGAGLVVSEALYVDEDASRAYFRQPGLVNDAHRDAWRGVVDAVHAAGGRIFAQLQHAGRLAEPGLNRRVLGMVGGTASGLSWQTGRPYAAAAMASAGELEEIALRFGEAALRARQAGFDGVEVHGARGYLVNESLSQTNLRADAWGGPAQRIRLTLSTAILQSIRRMAGPLPIGFNYSIYKMDDFRYQPPEGEAALAETFQALRAAGADILHLSGRRILRPEAWGRTLLETATSAAPGATMANGGLATLADAEQAVQHAGATVAAISRPFLANPDWIERCLQGRELRAYAPGMERAPLLATP